MKKGIMRLIKISARWVISIALLCLLISKIDITAFAELLGRSHQRILFYSFVVILCARFINYYRLYLLLSTNGVPVHFKDLVRVCWICDFGGFFLPGLIGNDMLRVFGVSKMVDSTKRAASAVVMDRFLGVFSLMIVAFVSMILARDVFYHEILFYLTLIALIAGLMSFVILLIIPIYIERLSGKIFHGNVVFRKIHQLNVAILDFSNHKMVLAKTLLICILIQLLRCFTAYLVANALGLDIHFRYFCFFVPIVFVAIMIPISIGGFGVREGAFIYLFSIIGISSTDAFAISILTSILQIMVALPGGVLYMRYGFTNNNVIKREVG